MKRKIIMILSVIIFSLSVLGVYTQRKEANNTLQNYESLREQVSEAAEKEEINSSDSTSDALNNIDDSFMTEEPIQEVTEPVILDKYAELLAQNSDLVGWLSNDDSISYPIMQNLSDSNYYLHRDFNKSESSAGSLYIPNDISMNSSMTIIYGHHMKDDSMFGSLKKYLDADYLADHPTFTVSDLYEDREYQVIGVFLSQIYDDSYEGFEYYNYRGDLTEDKFNEYIEGITPLMQIGDLSDVSYGDSFVELVTCAYHVKDGRLVVLCKMIS